jgi:hypothetical protein
MQVDATCLSPTTRLAQVLNMPYSKSLADGSRKNGTHDREVLVGDLVGRRNLVESRAETLEQLFELVELGYSDGVGFQCIEPTANRFDDLLGLGG